MYIMKHIYAIALLLAGITLTASAQEDSGTLPVLAQNPDALSASMGQTGGSTLSGGHYIYSAPGAVFDRSERFSLSYTGIIGTGHDSMRSGSGFYNAVTGSWRFRDKHALIAGFRYLGGGSVLTSTESGDGREIHPMDITADLGYALRINNHWRAYVVGHFVESYIGKIALTGGGSLGTTYGSRLSSLPLSYTLGASLRNLGGAVLYGKKSGKYTMPGSVTLAGDLRYGLTSEWTLIAAATGDYLVQPASAGQYAVGLGLGAAFLDVMSFQLGGTILPGQYHLTGGICCQPVRYASVGLSWRVAPQLREANHIALSVGCHF